MSTVTHEMSNDISIITFDNGPTNPVGPALVNDLDLSLDTAVAQSRGLVLCGGTKFLSIGLDLPELLKLNRSDMTDFWYAFNRVVFKLYTLSMPTACAMEGHAPGAGAILALACDFRLSADKKALFGLNEIQLNLYAPYIATLMIRQVLQQADADEILYTGTLIPPEKAEQIGLVSGLFPKEEVKQQAISKIKTIVPFSREAFAASKAIKTEYISTVFKKNEEVQNRMFLDMFFSAPAQEALHKALKNF